VKTAKGVVALLALTVGGVAHAGPDWSTTLLPRDLDGNSANGPEAFYDTVQNLTWIANWSLATQVGFADAKTWADSLTLGGRDDWRLPAIALPSTCQAYNCTNSELGKLWYTVLGNVAPGAETTGPFLNVTSGPYWLAPQASSAQTWVFNASSGFQSLANVGERQVGIAVRSGDTLPVPEPSTAALLMAGLTLVIGGRRRLLR
jgi:hypothetical protein